MKEIEMLDTNLWIYLFSKSDIIKFNKVKSLIEYHYQNIFISTHILGEITNVLIKKMKLDFNEINNIIFDLIKNFKPFEITPITIVEAIRIAEKYQYSYWDCLVISSALANKCKYLFTEDLHNNQLIENKLLIQNPFVN